MTNWLFQVLVTALVTEALVAGFQDGPLRGRWDALLEVGDRAERWPWKLLGCAECLGFWVAAGVTMGCVHWRDLNELDLAAWLASWRVALYLHLARWRMAG